MLPQPFFDCYVESRIGIVEVGIVKKGFGITRGTRCPATLPLRPVHGPSNRSLVYF